MITIFSMDLTPYIWSWHSLVAHSYLSARVWYHFTKIVEPWSSVGILHVLWSSEEGKWNFCWLILECYFYTLKSVLFSFLLQGNMYLMIWALFRYLNYLFPLPHWVIFGLVIHSICLWNWYFLIDNGLLITPQGHKDYWVTNGNQYWRWLSAVEPPLFMTPSFMTDRIGY